VETASWFGVDHIELYRNGHLETVIRVDPDPEEIVDFDQTLDLPMPDEDSWYVLVAYGLNSEHLMAPIYKRVPWGQMLISSIITMGGTSILLSFNGLVSEVQPILEGLGMSMEGLLTSALGSQELPDVFKMLPILITNPIWVDLDGAGFTPPDGVDADGDGVWDLPPFCSRPCLVEPMEDDDGNFSGRGQSICGENQVCRPDAEGAQTGTCAIPIPDGCVGVQAKE